MRAPYHIFAHKGQARLVDQRRWVTPADRYLSFVISANFDRRGVTIGTDQALSAYQILAVIEALNLHSGRVPFQRRSTEVDRKIADLQALR